jgi:murein DD-endopeptidase MepM/ murein hydrolase activator NlpD
MSLFTRILIRAPIENWSRAGKTGCSHVRVKIGKVDIIPTQDILGPISCCPWGLLCWRWPVGISHTSADFSGGLTAFLDYGGGVATSFRHLQQIFCAPGTYVKRGECIGTSGRSGIIQWSGGLIPPHLHVTLWVNGLPTDLFQNGRDPQSMCYWIKNENQPRRALSGDEQWDYTRQWRFLDKATLLQQAALTDSGSRHFFLPKSPLSLVS